MPPRLHPFAKELQQHKIEGDERTNKEYGVHNGSFSTYFRNKQIKLDTQAKESYNAASSIFKNCVIYITGHTYPSYAELKRLIVENGGQICAFLGGKSYATHIIATTLTSRKHEQYANYKVAKPEWILESVKAQRLLDWTRFRSTKDTNGQDFFLPKAEYDTNILGYNEEADILGDSPLDETFPVSEPTSVPGMKLDLLDTPGRDGDNARRLWILAQRQHVDCLAPNFISSYFAKSRLHFLSTRKLDLRRRCRQYKPNVEMASCQPVKRTLLYVDFDSFFVAVALKKRPDLKDVPVCVSHGGNTSDVASCNYPARARGVANGMWVGHARKLCPELICLPYDFEEYERCSNILYDTLISLGPLGITAISVDEAIVDISNLTKPAEHTCETVREVVSAKTKIEVSAGVGSNILLAKLALRRAKPAGQYILMSDMIGDFNVRDLPGVGRNIASKLAEIDVLTVLDLRRVSLGELQDQIGNAHGQRLYGYARGMDSSDIKTLDVSVRTVGLELGYGVRLVNEDEKAKFIINCAEELANRLDRADQDCEVLTVKIYSRSEGAPFITPKHMGHGECDIRSRSRKVPAKPSRDLLHSVTQNLIASLHCPPMEFRGIGLHMRVSDSGNFFDTKQSRLTEMRSPGKVTPSKPMISIPPRKRRRQGMTLTQMVPPAQDNSIDTSAAGGGKIDMNVLAALPTQIRKEVLMYEDDILPIDMDNVEELPIYRASAFLGLRSDYDLRNLVMKWIKSSRQPTIEDARSFFRFVQESASEDSLWLRTIDIVDWVGMLTRNEKVHDDWRHLHQILDNEVQRIAHARSE